MREAIEDVLGGLVAVILCSACGPAGPKQPSEPAPSDAAPRYAQARCAAMFECPCGGHRAFETPAECTAAIEDQFDALVETFQEKAGFQQDCFDKALADWSVPSACSESPDGGPLLVPPCQLYIGAQKEGETCVGAYTGAFVASNCASGLMCDGERCRPTHSGSVPTNKTGYGEACTADRQCKGYCDDEAHVCTPEVVTGSACTKTTMCSADDYCLIGDSGLGTCTARPTFGQACPSADFRFCYGVGTACVDGFCATPDSVACGQGYLETWW